MTISQKLIQYKKAIVIMGLTMGIASVTNFLPTRIDFFADNTKWFYAVTIGLSVYVFMKFYDHSIKRKRPSMPTQPPVQDISHSSNIIHPAQVSPQQIPREDFTQRIPPQQKKEDVFDVFNNM